MSANKDNPIKQEKLRKRGLLLKQGVDPYPHTWHKKSWDNPKLSKSANLAKQDVSEEISTKTFYMAGRLMRKRPMGKASFFNLQDQWGEFQCYIRKDSFDGQKNTHTKEEKDSLKDSFKESQKQEMTKKSEDLNPWDLWKLCDIGDILSVKGQLFKTKTGQLSLKIQDLNILCKSVEPLPEKYHGLEDIELKYRYRHLDLIMDEKSREIFKTRSNIIYEIRAFMCEQGFIEMETPVLQPIYGGAMAEPFETHFRRLDRQKMYLKVSPEIYLKKLIVGGFEKVFEIGKNFRNEGIDRTHNPEFTMMEYYQAYTDYLDQMDLFEKLVNHVVKSIKGSLEFEYQGRKLDFNKWERLTLKTALQKYSDLKINKDNELLKKALPKGHSCLDPNKLSYLELFDCIKKIEPSGDYKKFEEVMKIKPISKEREEDLKEELVVLAFEILVEKHLWNPVFITDFPLSVSPLTKKHRDKKFPRLVERFEPYIAGMELGNAYTELNDPLDQRKRLQDQNRWLDQDQQKESSKELPKESLKESLKENIDENFLHALEVGMPPTGGVGLGIERLVMILSNQKSIRDCILFPALKKL